MSSFTYNGYPEFAPVGGIAHHIGVTDPDGWLICDGVTRATVSDSRYAALATLLNAAYGTSANNGNSITPPDLRARYLSGASNTNTVAQTTGQATHTLDVNTTPTHNHGLASVTTSQKNYNSHAHSTAVNTGGQANSHGGGSGRFVLVGGGASGVMQGGQHSHTFSGTTDSIGSGIAFSLIPPSTILNFIIKY